MKLKSLLIGSAALAAATTGARAADIIVAPEPEPMEYVRVCDVYGAGFFYIPGTETCLKIGGYVRYQINWHEDDDGWRKFARGNLVVDARSETEYGTLGALIDLRADWNSGRGTYTDDSGHSDREAYLNQAIISLGGLSMGVGYTLFDDSLSGEFDSAGYDSSIHFMRYTFVPGNGFSVSLALEENDDNFDYTPNVVGMVGVSQGWGSLNVYGAYDATAEEFTAKAIAKIKATQALTVELLGTYESGDNLYSVWWDDGAVEGYEFSAAAYLKYAATDKLTVGFGGQYFSGQHTTDADDWALGGVVDYQLVENFNTKLAVNYWDGDSAGEDGHFSGFLRFQRNF